MEAERLADRAEAAQRNGGDRARQSPVARVESGEARIGFRSREAFVERALKRQRVGDRLGGDQTRRQPGRSLRRRRRRSALEARTEPAGVFRVHR